MKKGEKLPFNKLIKCNIGNPQSLNQKPITFLRRVIAACNCPELLNHPELFPEDVMVRASNYLKNTPV